MYAHSTQIRHIEGHAAEDADQSVRCAHLASTWTAFRGSPQKRTITRSDDEPYTTRPRERLQPHRGALADLDCVVSAELLHSAMSTQSATRTSIRSSLLRAFPALRACSFVSLLQIRSRRLSQLCRRTESRFALSNRIRRLYRRQGHSRRRLDALDDGGTWRRIARHRRLRLSKRYSYQSAPRSPIRSDLRLPNACEI